MTGLPLAALLVSVLSAQPDMTLPSRGMQACLNNASSASMFYNRLAPAGKTKFNEMYNAFAAMVQKRKGEGWTHGMMGNQSTNWRRSFREFGIMGLFKVADSPSTQAELQREITQLEREYPNAGAARRKEIWDRLTVIRKQHNFPRGVCEDWAKETVETVRPIAGGEFRVEWRENRRGGHAVAFVTHAETRSCIAMDPWPRGLPELVGCDEAEDISPLQTPSCFAVYDPPS